MKNFAFIEDFWKRADEAIYNSGLTKQEISRKMGCDRKTLYTTCNCMSGPNIAKFCEAVNVSADWLLGLTNGKKNE